MVLIAPTEIVGEASDTATVNRVASIFSVVEESEPLPRLEVSPVTSVAPLAVPVILNEKLQLAPAPKR